MRAAASPCLVVASDAFKGSLTSLEVADAVRLGLLDVAPLARVVVVPVADGGEGTVAAALAAGWRGVPVEVHGPTGEPLTATLAVAAPHQRVSPRLDAAAPQHSSAPPPHTAAPQHSSAPPPHTAAPQHSSAPPPHTAAPQHSSACGLGRLPGGIMAPLTASSRGLGEAMRAALDQGAAEVVVGIGGSASTDGGAGMLAALGARLLDADGHDLPDGGGALAGLERLDLSGLDPRLAGIRLVLAADVDSPLLGPPGAAAVFAPQKGATTEDVVVLEAGLTRWAEAVAGALPLPPAGPRSTNRSKLSQQPGAGAAGGVGFALLAVLGAERRSGVDVVLDLVGLDRVLADADLVITGEGSLDEQTLTGKAVVGVGRRAGAHGIPVVAVCGRLALDDAGLDALGVRAAYPLSELEPDPHLSISGAAALLRRTGRRIAREWVSAPPG